MQEPIEAEAQSGFKKKSDQTTNFLYLSDSQGILLGIWAHISGNHHDLYDFQTHFEEVISWSD